MCFLKGGQVEITKITAAIFPRGSKKRKSNNDDKHDRGQEKRRPSIYVEGKSLHRSCRCGTTIHKTNHILIMSWQIGKSDAVRGNIIDETGRASSVSGKVAKAASWQRARSCVLSTPFQHAKHEFVLGSTRIREHRSLRKTDGTNEDIKRNLTINMTPARDPKRVSH